MNTIDSHMEQDCIRLSARFAVLVDWRQYDQVAELFTNDAIFSRSGEVYEGVDSIKELLNARPRTLKTLHLCGLPTIRSISPTEADGLVPFVFISSQSQKAVGPADGPQVTATGYYLDLYRRTEQGWKIASRTVEQFFTARL